MLYLSRKIGESVVINNSIELTITEIRGKTVKIGFNFPPEASVLRKEIFDRIRAENVAAASGAGDDGGFFEAEFDLSHLDAPKPE